MANFTCTNPADPTTCVTDPLNDRFSSIGDIISQLLPFVFTIAGMVALLFLIWGGIRYMTARGDPKAVDSARSTITSAIIGILIVLLSATLFFIIGSVLKINIFGTLVPTVHAAPPEPVDIGCYVKLGGICIKIAFPTFGSLLSNIIILALAASGLIFFFMMIWGGFRYLNAGGDPKNADAARQTLTNAGIGLLIVVVSFFIIELITRVVGAKSIFSP